MSSPASRPTETPTARRPRRLDALDRAVSRRMAVDWPHPRWLTAPLSLLSLSGNYGIIWYVIALVPWLAGAPRPLAKALYVVVAVTAVDLLGFAVKQVIGRNRPPIADPSQPVQIPLPFSKSFPSSHASMSMVGTLTVSMLYPDALPLLVLLAAVLCFSRVYLGVHYAGDVLGGVVFGLVFGAAYVLLVPAPLS